MHHALQVVLTRNGEPVETENGGMQEFGMQDDGLRATVPSDDYRGRPLWNVYPLDEADIDTADGYPRMSTVKRPEPPFQKAPNVDAASATPAPTTTPAPTPSPDAEPNPAPQPTETPAP